MKKLWKQHPLPSITESITKLLLTLTLVSQTKTSTMYLNYKKHMDGMHKIEQLRVLHFQEKKKNHWKFEVLWLPMVHLMFSSFKLYISKPYLTTCYNSKFPTTSRILVKTSLNSKSIMALYLHTQSWIHLSPTQISSLPHELISFGFTSSQSWNHL